MKYRFWILGLLALSLLWACNRTKEVILPHTYEIFPTDSGSYRISLVKSITFSTSDTIIDDYYKKEQLGNLTQDVLGRAVTRVLLFRSPIANGSDYVFEFDRLYSQYLEPNQETTYFAERLEENQRVLVLKFPVYPGISWNGNAFNSLGFEAFRYIHVDSTVTVQGVDYPNSVVVVQQDDTLGLINYKYVYEVYAPRIGLIKRSSTILVHDGPNGEFNSDASSLYFEEIVEHN